MTDNQPNPPLAIPNHVLDAGHTVVLDSRVRGLDVGQTSARVLHEAGPLLVAAELRRLASDLYRRSDNVPLSRTGGGIERVGALRDLADQLSTRADQLDGGTR
jgi:hypothetical protein